MKIEKKKFSNNHSHQDHLEEAHELNKIAISKFHRAAAHGYVDMLCEASKKDTNLANEKSGFTPTLLAANNGHLDALRILVGRGGDPEKTTLDGSNALHLATYKNHLNCVSFLVNFGVNMWALNNELHTAKDIAAIEQRKEILDFLDQMMAKQSALNTKQVQKLKEKAKVAAEKRIKQMRKAQLKAIKQVEKDERFLVKLSHNRRLLKAAHSISDIRLVGRCDAINYIPEHKSSSSNLMKLSTTNSTAISSNHLILSSKAGQINHSIDLLGQRKQLINFRTKAALSSASSSTNSDDSAYSSSSVSSASGYLSTVSSSSVKGQPKYSDLVAVNNDINNQFKQQKPLSKQQQQQQQTQPAQLTESDKNNNSKHQETSSNGKQSLKSNSTIGTKLRKIGGVSRKVKLKRMLLINSSSVSSSSSGEMSSSGGDTRKTKSQSNSPSESESSTSNGRNSITFSLVSETANINNNNNSKLCNVQPAIKLKLTNTDSCSPSKSTTLNQLQSHQLYQQTSTGNNHIKWPPAPSLTRAKSEPNFAITLASNEDEQEELKSASNKETNTNVMRGFNNELFRNNNSDSKQKMMEYQVKHNQEYSITNNVKDQSKILSNNINVPKSRDESQQNLLNQCLSQLKLRHEAITSKRTTVADNESPNHHPDSNQVPQMKVIDTNNNNNLENNINKLFNNARQQLNTTTTIQQIANTNIPNNSSDELIKHQLKAGDFPLRPSVIKQQQQQQQQQQNKLQQQYHLEHNMLFNNFNNNQNETRKSTTTVSIDSIGSAGSFAQSNSQTCSSVKYSESPRSSLSCTPSYGSSIEVTQTKQTPMTKNLIDKIQAQITDSNGQYGPDLSKMSQYSNDAQMILKSNNDLETIDTFLIANGLIELKEVFAKEKIDLEALVLLSEEDLKSLNILLGPRRKLFKAIEERRRRSITKPMYVMVDTLL